MSAAGEVPPTIIQHIITKSHDDWKYSVELTVGPADARWTLKARGDVLSEVLADIDTQRAHLAKPAVLEEK